MLFDLRSRGRRRTVQFVYLGLAVLMGGGLILFGVGTGSGNGGLLNAFTGSSSNPQNAVVSQQTKAAERQAQLHPTDPAAWAALVNAHYSDANSSGYSSATSTYTTAGRKQLAQTTQAWQRYASLTGKPDVDVATVAARAYGVLGQYSDAAAAWQAVTQASPGGLKGYECLALSAYAAKQTRVAGLAETKVLGQLPKSQRAAVKAQIEAAKTNPATAAQC